jgi:serine/threonine protein kinase
MYQLTQFTQGEVLGRGMNGTVYNAVKNGKVSNDVVIKVEKVLIDNPGWKLENKFALDMGSNHPEHFLVLYDFETIEDCDHKQIYPFDPTKRDAERQKRYAELAASPWCIRRLYSRIDTVYADIDKRSEPLSGFYSMLAQIYYIIELMQAHGWSHRDLNRNNLGIKYTDEKVINLGNVTVPTFGRRYCAIDYGGVKEILEPNLDLVEFPTWISNIRLYKEEKLEKIPIEDAIEKFREIGLLDKYVVTPFSKRILMDILLIAETDIFRKTATPTAPAEYRPINLFIEKEDLVFYAANWKKPSILKKYFADKCWNL